MAELKPGLTNQVRKALYTSGFDESPAKGVPGFHVWISQREVGTVFVDVRLHRDRFQYASTPPWGRDQITKYSKALTDKGFVVQQRDHIPVPRLAVSNPVHNEAHEGGQNHG